MTRAQIARKYWTRKAESRLVRAAEARLEGDEEHHRYFMGLAQVYFERARSVTNQNAYWDEDVRSWV